MPTMDENKKEKSHKIFELLTENFTKKNAESTKNKYDPTTELYLKFVPIQPHTCFKNGIAAKDSSAIPTLTTF